MGQVTDVFKETIKAMLVEEAGKDPLFAASLNKDNKSIDECCDFIVQQVKESGRCGFADSEILGIAKHYYDEDDIKKPGKIGCKVVVNRSVELSEEDKEKARRQAVEELVAQEKRRMQKHKPMPKKELENSQISLF